MNYFPWRASIETFYSLPISHTILLRWKTNESCVGGAARLWVVSISVLTTFTFLPHQFSNLTSSGQWHLMHTCVFNESVKAVLSVNSGKEISLLYHCVCCRNPLVSQVFPWHGPYHNYMRSYKTLLPVYMKFIRVVLYSPDIISLLCFISNHMEPAGVERMSDSPPLSSRSSP